ncbi:MAG: STAS domain-containing protein [Dehalococcoidales bacterium]|nr:MAG: STAS domain-containing protein [Dehalococcoidales bacterium]
MKVIRVSARACLIELPSELNSPDEEPILDACTSEVSGTIHYIILDFNAVQTMNGLGTSMLVKLNALARRRGQHLLAFGVNDHYRDVLEVTGLGRVVSVYDKREDAYSLVGASPGDDTPEKSMQSAPSDVSFWAKPVSRLSVPPMPPKAININMKGRRVVGPVDGFGQLWQKTYRLRVSKVGVTPEDAIQAIKENFPSFQPSFNRFYPSPTGIQPGEVVLIDSSTPGGPVSTGVMVLYADDKSFTFITPQGHPESGWVTFSAFEEGGSVTVQIIGLARANDPVYEIAFRTVGSKMQTGIWKHVLGSLAEYLDISAEVSVDIQCVDTRMQWSQAGNVWYNAQIRTLLYMPLWWFGKLLGNRGNSKSHAG